MNAGRLIAVVGPSGVGKDSVMAGIRNAMPHTHLVRRVITRAPGLGGEDFDAVSDAEFASMAANGDFAVFWHAHGLSYGIPASVKGQLAAGTDCLVNFSRQALAEAAALFPGFRVLNITAKPETLAQRLAQRGRETPTEIAKRLAQAAKPLPAGLDVIHLSNDGPLDRTITQAVTLLQPVRA
ncbi:phosphonate metabolism protein/1,5-bisphosphokinase (PRPP-forming) PhnN [Sulfitobacter sp. M57]|uniref:phosphonate metabolism protein/1,5-bisphosphokinase (PRPP-forming) PhnN n=1 Tax=unclassified Sulfitobacter TaxID=196795 RepID=UPI0023E26C3D|nr:MULTISPECIES: phosphonate metabolism protein/1,5-bisphosphokinase (PRPP-forming) PhnN [unclassified Sulfitobacter]MDF3415135.1 phosphonate metabolism protein/1,5-bisphosphokinase (PRPP-forming) PhnN [Sulfitobacter sp. KE5]MDF3422616.1 phosphonate metabolism protein/1,5-bisphosphokinase (PRPP-forming) PhnN [Sulfitobacter sp. KE43]MDF3433681.1 phosphonate metabolism protein/1,5-bisphosphokinase (PRPP-forming) PhnN [Sulfitobacter sp. KE42]MDF3459321.1 phosphonate metabolism protein/1,5-bisphosp